MVVVVLRALGNAVVALIATVPGYWFTVAFIDKWGRVPIQFMGFIMMTLLLAVLAGVYGFLVPPAGSSRSPKPWLFLVLYAATFFFANFGPNATTFVVPSEGECCGRAAGRGERMERGDAAQKHSTPRVVVGSLSPLPLWFRPPCDASGHGIATLPASSADGRGVGAVPRRRGSRSRSFFFCASFFSLSSLHNFPSAVFHTRYRSTLHGISAAMGKLGAIVGAFGFGEMQLTAGTRATL